jgi:hypothetical protein
MRTKERVCMNDQADQDAEDMAEMAMREAEYEEHYERWRLRCEEEAVCAFVEFIKSVTYESSIAERYLAWVANVKEQNDLLRRMSLYGTHEFIVGVCVDWKKHDIAKLSPEAARTIDVVHGVAALECRRIREELEERTKQTQRTV